jgi:hypothetical protein
MRADSRSMKPKSCSGKPAMGVVTRNMRSSPETAANYEEMGSR